MGKVARTAYLHEHTDREIIALSEEMRVTTSEIIRECVLIAFTENMVHNELRQRLKDLAERESAAQQGKNERVDGLLNELMRE